MFGSCARCSPCYPQRCICLLFVCLFVVVLWLHGILGKTCKRLNKIKFLKSELNRSEPKPVEGHGKASPEFQEDELRFASYRECGTRQGCHSRWTVARAKERFAVFFDAAGELEGVSHRAICFSLLYAPLI